MNREQYILRVSIVVTVILAGIGVAFGLLAGSTSIIFDGIYTLTDAVMTILALLVARLIALSQASGPTSRKLDERFTMGFWHLEPMVLGLNGVLLMAAATYALITSIDSFLNGGRPLSFDYAIIYATISLVCEVSMAIYVRRANRSVGSDLVALDGRAWVMPAGLTCALLFAFGAGYIIQGTRHEWISPYIDPAVLALMCLIIIPVPIATVRQALADILLVTPRDLKLEVDTVAREMVKRFGFSSYRAYVARVGRGKQIELFFIVPPNGPARRLEEWDAMRDEIGEALGEESPDRWLTIVFTTDLEWAE
ncbi:cation diffusion facilitator family transporter [Pseudochelatococcus contaminans]|uniref:Putative Co/Zn/Cd cation transporter (Cation efflux family) n=1 Tax=Pseudochelatococcus contaminans TaxID=1538103 RepID=A0A7W5Z1F4_9HYPH|nr:cation transporter [Pseudochelatococcus contaminans]MBB3808315.1 putative Co/Zn/Cd cation transporter (cation efflux family) [Pseudochelatococcus contaminans]